MTLPVAEVLTFGETMGSIRAAGPLRAGGAMSMSLGGAETNVAIGLARLDHTVRWAGRLGDDEVGRFALRTLRAESVLTDAVTIDPTRPTGLMLLEKRIADISRASYYRAGSAGAELCIEDLRQALAAIPRILHLTGITAALSGSAADATRWAAEAARKQGTMVSLDVNFRSKLWPREEAAVFLEQLVPFVDIVIASEDELDLVAPAAAAGEIRPAGRERAAAADASEFADVSEPADVGENAEDAGVQELLARGVQQVIIKRGAAGASAWADGSRTSLPARTVPVVDTVGAGDAFTAGYLSALLDGLDMEARLDRAVTLGAFSVGGSGDWEFLPTRAELPLLEQSSGATIR